MVIILVLLGILVAIIVIPVVNTACSETSGQIGVVCRGH